jgi:thioredoxin 2
MPPLAAPVDVDSTSFDQIVSAARAPILIDFWAAWCGPCRIAAPEVQKTAEAMSGRAIVLKADTERAPELAQRFNIMSIPTFIVIRNGRIVHRQAGVIDHRLMINWLTQAGA